MSENIPSYDEVLAMLSAKAREGSVTALCALERALRNREPEEADEVGEAIHRILEKHGR